MYRIASLAALAVVLTPVVAHAQASGDDDTVDEIIVSANPLGRTTEELTQPARVLGSDELLLKATNSIGDTLASEPGVSTTYFGPVAGRPVIRGLEGPRISVLQSGVGTLDVADLSPDHAVPVEPLFVERVEILRGPATLLYGSSAAGGVVNVIDGKFAERPAESNFGGAIELRADTVAETRAIAGRLDGGNDQIAWHLNAFTRESDDIDIDGFATADPAERPPEEPEGTVINSAGEADGIGGGITFFGENRSIGIAVSTYNNEYGLPGPEEEEEPAPGEPEEPAIFPGPFIDLEQTRIDLRSTFEFDGPIESLKIRTGINDYEHSETEPSGEIATVYENDARELRIEAVHAEAAGWRGAFGIQYIDREFSAVGAEAFIQPTDTQSVGVFLVEEREVSAGRIELGARVERLEHEPASAAEDYSDTAISLAAGFHWDIIDNHDLVFNLSRSERNLDAAELYADGPHLATGQFELGLVSSGLSVETEVSNNLDVAWHHHGDRLDWNLSVFYNDIADFVVLQPTGGIDDGLPVFQFTQEDAELYGYEAELTWRASDNWTLEAFADYVRGESDSGDLPRIQAPRLGGTLAFSQPSWTARLQGIHYLEQDDVSSFQTDSFTMLNASVVWRVQTGDASGVDVFLQGRNLLDEDARVATSFRAAFVPLPGANVEFGLRAFFQ